MRLDIAPRDVHMLIIYYVIDGMACGEDGRCGGRNAQSWPDSSDIQAGLNWTADYCVSGKSVAAQSASD